MWQNLWSSDRLIRPVNLTAERQILHGSSALWFHCISPSEDGHQKPSVGKGNVMRLFFIVASVLFALGIGTGVAGETPKHGGTMNFIIPAEAPPSLDGHREGTFATVHMVAPFYSVLMRVDPETPSVTTRFDCDLCTAIPTATDDGKTYTFNIREGVRFQDESPLTADDVAASWRHIIFPPPGVLSARQESIFRWWTASRGTDRDEPLCFG